MNENKHVNHTRKDNSSLGETNIDSSIEVIQKGGFSQSQNQKQSKETISNILIEEYSQEFMNQQLNPNKNIQNKQIDLIKNEYSRKVSSQGDDGSQSGTPFSKNKKKQQRDQEFDLKFKRLGLGQMDIPQQDLQESQIQKKKVDGYAEDIQVHLDHSLFDMRGFLDRRYYLLVNQLDKVREKLLVYYEELKNMENKINKDKQIKVIMMQLANYQSFSQSLKKDIELMKVNIKKEEEQALGLYQVYQYRKQQLSLKNKENLNISKQIIEIQNNINNFRRLDDTTLSYPLKANILSLNNSQNITQQGIQVDIQKKILNNNNLSINEQSYNQQQDSLNINLNIPGQSIDFSKIQAQTERIQSLGQIKRGIISNPRQILQNDPLSKIEAYCGTLKMIKKNNSISMKHLSKKNVNEQNNSPNKEIIQQNDTSIISQLQQSNISSSYIALNKNNSQKYLARSLQLSLQKNKASSILDPKEIIDSESYELDMTYKQIEKFKQKNLTLKNKIIQNCNNFFELYQLYEDSLQSERKSLQKSQRKVLKDQGLQGSLFFEMQKAELFLTELDMKQKITKIKFKPNLQDREMRFIVHDTLKSMLDNKQQKHKKEYQKDDFQLDWQSFKQTSPIQIIGLMSLKPQVFEESKSEFEKKARLIKERISKSKTLAGILETKNQTNTFDFY